MLNEIEVKDAEVLNCPPDRSPIFYVNLTGKIKQGRSKKSYTHKVKEVVAKGTIEEIKKKYKTKKSFIRGVFGSLGNVHKKVEDFDLTKITITDVEVLKFLGYGTKCD